MNRREALQLLVSLPAVTDVRRAALQPGDVIIVECSTVLTLVARERIVTMLGKVWPGHHILVCDANVRIRIAPRMQAQP